MCSSDLRRAQMPLLELLGDERSLVRLAAVEALGHVGDSEATESLQALLKSEDTHLRDEAFRALEQMRKRGVRVD